MVHIGDLVDNHAVNYHEHDPDGRSPKDEMDRADKHLALWFKAFPSLYFCLGNHDRMVDRKSKTVGLPSRVFQPFEKIWNLPKGWRVDFRHNIDGVLYEHGTGFTGDYAHMRAAALNRQSTVIGHVHHICTMGYTRSAKDTIFGMAVGCGIHDRSYAFGYGRDLPKRPVLGCGVVTDGGKFAQVFKMA